MKTVWRRICSSLQHSDSLQALLIVLITILAFTGVIGSAFVAKTVYAHDQCEGDGQCGPTQKCVAGHPKKAGRHCVFYGNPYQNPDPCAAQKGRPNGCGCRDNDVCGSQFCQSPNGGGTCQPKPTPNPCAAQQGRPNGCGCANDNVCGSGFCQGEQGPGNGTCQAKGPCQKDKDRPNECGCNNDDKCASNNCVGSHNGGGGGTCKPQNGGGGGKPTRPQLDVSPMTQEVCYSSPYDIFLIIDDSNSMANKIQKARDAAHEFVNKMQLASQKPNAPLYRIGIATFDDNGGIHQGLTNNWELLHQKIGTIVVKGAGGTCAECAIDQRGTNDVYHAFAQTNTATTRKVAILISDGYMNRFVQPNGDIEGSGDPEDEKKARDQAKQAMRRTGAQFFVIQYGGGGPPKDPDYMRNIARDVYGGGKYSHDPNLNELTQTFSKIANTILGGSIAAEIYGDDNGDGIFQSTPTIGANGQVYVEHAIGTYAISDPLGSFGGSLPDGWAVTLDSIDPNEDATQPTVDVNNVQRTVFQNLCQSKYQVTVTLKPGYYTSPAGSSNSKPVDVYGGLLTKVQFGVTGTPPADPWFRSYGLDMRFDQWPPNKIPTTACGGTPNAPYASLPSIPGITGLPSVVTPGIMFSGGAPMDFAPGSASQPNWMVQSPLAPQQGGALRTSYTQMYAKIKKSGEEVKPLVGSSATCASASSCSPSGALESGVYKVDGPLTLTGWTVPANRTYTLLVDGKLTISGAINVKQANSVLVVSASDDIVVSSNVGATRGCPTYNAVGGSTQIDGLFSTDQEFIIQKNQNLGLELTLNMSGAVVVNAALTPDGGFVNTRNLGGEYNKQFPTFTIRARPDFILNMPSSVKTSQIEYREVAP